jgi:hypothetical protein
MKGYVLMSGTLWQDPGLRLRAASGKAASTFYLVSRNVRFAANRA